MVGGRQIDPKVGPRDADHLDIVVVDREVPADHVGIALEPALPELMTDHDAARERAALILRLDQRAPERHRSQHRQHIVCSTGRGDAFHHIVHDEARVTALDRRDVRDETALLSQIERAVRRGVGARDSLRVRLNRDDSTGIGVRERAPEHGVDHAEHRDVDADAERDREDDEERVTR